LWVFKRARAPDRLCRSDEFMRLAALRAAQGDMKAGDDLSGLPDPVYRYVKHVLAEDGKLQRTRKARGVQASCEPGNFADRFDL
jgi:hypothetical protein